MKREYSVHHELTTGLEDQSVVDHSLSFKFSEVSFNEVSNLKAMIAELFDSYGISWCGEE